MRRLVATLAAAAVLVVPSLAAQGSPSGPGGPAAPAEPGPRSHTGAMPDDLLGPRATKQRAMRERAQELVLTGKRVARGKNKVVKVGPSLFVELAREREDSIFTVLGEFGDAEIAHEHGSHGSGSGPLHNEIPEPDRDVDNFTIWDPDFSPAHYEELLFDDAPGANSMRNYYIEQSSGRYAVNGDVSDWVQVPGNAASYGSNYCGSIICDDSWAFVDDSLDAWVDSSGMDAGELQDYLADFDVWDRYDHDLDGDFDEPDGYLDHFQAVHAGIGEESCSSGCEDLLWSHRSYAHYLADGPDGPGPEQAPFGGVEIGDTGFWVADYTMQPENGGLGVFAHEFGHDLGLPDLYDTSGNTGGASNSTGFWTLMSFGSFGTTGAPEAGIGSKPTHMGNFEKLLLGWLDVEVVAPHESRDLLLGPAEHTWSNAAQGGLLLLPDNVVDVQLGAPYTGERFFWSDQGNLLDNTMAKSVTIGTGAFSAAVRYDIETDWDYAYLTVDGEPVLTNLSTDFNPNSQNFGNGITGSSGGEWVQLTADLSAYAGQTVELGFRYWTDPFVDPSGLQVDQIMLDGTLLGGGEGEEGWAFDGFRTTTGSETESFFNAYVLENRQYLGYDDSLRTGPHNFGFFPELPDWAEHFAYRRGLVITYWNTQYEENNVGDHPGGGQALPVDAHPQFEHWADGSLIWPGITSYDAAFGPWPVPALDLHRGGVPFSLPPKPAVRTFDDTRPWWSNCDRHGCTGSHPGHHQPGWYGVDVPPTGTTVKVTRTRNQGLELLVRVN